jgi:hypothetical protein
MPRPEWTLPLAFQTPIPFSRHREIVRKHAGPSVRVTTNGNSAMWAFIDSLYREYCFARLQEIRKYELSH